MPIHIRAEPGEYAEAVLLPGDPLRAKYIAETYFDDAVAAEQRARPARLHRHLEGQAGLGAGNRDGLPGRDDRLRGADPARLQEADPRRHLRRAPGEPRARRPDRRADRRAGRLDRDAPRRRTSRTARPRRGRSSTRRCTSRSTPARRCTSARSSRATSSTTRTRASTSAGRRAACSRSRWRPRRSSRSRALRGVESACLLTVSDIVVEGVFTRITDEELRARRRPDDEARARRRHRRHDSPALTPGQDAVFLVNPASANGSTGKRWPELQRRARELGLDGDDAPLGAARPPDRARAARPPRTARLLVVVGGDGTLNEVVNGVAGTGAEIAVLPPGPARTSAAPTGSRPVRRGGPRRARRRAARDRPRPRRLPRAGRRRGERLLRERRLGRDERRGRAAGELDVEGARRPGDLLLRPRARVPRAGRTPR